MWHSAAGFANAAYCFFSCVSHCQQCLAPGGAQGQRKWLDAAQVGSLFQALLAMSLLWVAVIMLLQVVAGERGGCMCQAHRRWLLLRLQLLGFSISGCRGIHRCMGKMAPLGRSRAKTPSTTTPSSSQV